MYLRRSDLVRQFGAAANQYKNIFPEYFGNEVETELRHGHAARGPLARATLENLTKFEMFSTVALSTKKRSSYERRSPCVVLTLGTYATARP